MKTEFIADGGKLTLKVDAEVSTPKDILELQERLHSINCHLSIYTHVEHYTPVQSYSIGLWGRFTRFFGWKGV